MRSRNRTNCSPSNQRVLPAPQIRSPPCSHTVTGNPLPAAAAAGAPRGLNTFKNRQSSPMPGPAASGMGSGCTHALPKAVALSTPVHGTMGCAGAKRNAPTGGFAYRTPRHASTPPPRISPRREPCGVCTTGSTETAWILLRRPSTASSIRTRREPRTLRWVHLHVSPLVGDTSVTLVYRGRAVANWFVFSEGNPLHVTCQSRRIHADLPCTLTSLPPRSLPGSPRGAP
jgi:hypothetical protein